MGSKGCKKTKCERVAGLGRDAAAAAAIARWRQAHPGMTLRGKTRACSNCKRRWPDDDFERHPGSGRVMDLCPRCQWASRLNIAENMARKAGKTLPDRADFQPHNKPHYNPFTAAVLPSGPGRVRRRTDEPEPVVRVDAGPELGFPETKATTSTPADPPVDYPGNVKALGVEPATGRDVMRLARRLVDEGWTHADTMKAAAFMETWVKIYGPTGTSPLASE